MKEKQPKKEQEVKKPVLKKVVIKKVPLNKVEKAEEVKAPLSLVTLHNLKRPFGSHKKRKYLGRGPSSGHGKTSYSF